MNEIFTEDKIREIVRSELEKINPPKKKRGPNKWQIFLKTCVKRQDEKLRYPEKVQLCSVEYKSSKDSNNGVSSISIPDNNPDNNPSSNQDLSTNSISTISTNNKEIK